MVTLSEGVRAPFPRYWLSSFLSDFGDGVRLAAFPLLAVQYTHSPTAVAAITAVQGLPWLILGAGTAPGSGIPGSLGSPGPRRGCFPRPSQGRDSRA